MVHGFHIGDATAAAKAGLEDSQIHSRQMERSAFLAYICTPPEQLALLTNW